jgi:predicted nuclease of predicted toxin-antitoxin system
MTARLLVDENFPAPSIARLRNAGWDVVAMAEAAPGSLDPQVMEAARREQRWLVTFDSHFGALVFERRLPPPPLVLLLRVPSYRPQVPASWIEDLYSTGKLSEGAFHVFNGRSIRRRSFGRHGSGRPG